MSRNTEEIGTTHEKIKIFFYGTTGLSPRWITRFTILLVYAVSVLDPLFFYIPVVKNGDRKCISLDKKLETRVISLRSLVDLLYAIYIVVRLRYDFFASYRMYRGGQLTTSLWEIASEYLLRAFPLDFLSALPLPQVVLLIIVPTMMRGSRFLKAIYLLRSVVLFQYVPRVLRVYSLATSGTFGDAAEARFLLSPFIFILAINGIGGLWYFLSIERLVQCWDEACKNHHDGCLNLFGCNNNNVGNHKFLNEFCPRDANNTDFFDFGMFSHALQSRVVETTNVDKRLLYGLHWSLLSLSCFGQNLQTSTYLWENVLAISITISGLYLLLVFFVKLQAFRQAKRLRKEAEAMEYWSPFLKVPKHLKSDVRLFMRYDWRESVGDDMNKFLDELPEYLRQRIKVELYFELMEKVPYFANLGRPSLEAVCCRLSTVSYQKGACVIKRGKAIDKMLFIMDDLSVRGANSAPLTCGDFCGGELVYWVLHSASFPTLPRSDRDVKARRDVQALCLKAEDLKSVADRFGWYYDEDSAIDIRTGTPTDDQHRTIITSAQSVHTVGVRALMQRRR